MRTEACGFFVCDRLKRRVGLSLTCAEEGRKGKGGNLCRLGGFCAAFGGGKAMFWCSSEALEANAACERVSRKSRDF